MDEAKYIVYKDSFAGEIPVVFDPFISHAQMAEALGVREEIVGAGFVWFGADGALCDGESVSLKVKARKEKDSNLVDYRILRRHHW